MDTIKKYNNYMIVALLFVALMTTSKAQLATNSAISPTPVATVHAEIFQFQSTEPLPKMAEISLKGNYGQQKETRQQTMNNPLSSVASIFTFIGITAKKWGLMDIFTDSMYLILSVAALLFFIRIVY